jgi:hypothetical protein
MTIYSFETKMPEGIPVFQMKFNAKCYNCTLKGIVQKTILANRSIEISSCNFADITKFRAMFDNPRVIYGDGIKVTWVRNHIMSLFTNVSVKIACEIETVMDYNGIDWSEAEEDEINSYVHQAVADLDKVQWNMAKFA